MRSRYERIPLERLNAIGRATFDPEAASLLNKEAATSAALIGESGPKPAEVLKRLKVVSNSAKRIRSKAAGDSLEAMMVAELLSDTDDRLKEIADRIDRYIPLFERWAEAESPGRTRDPELLGFVQLVREQWHKAGGKGHGTYKSDLSCSHYDGPLLNLVRELLASYQCPKLPSDATIHDSIKHTEKNPYQGVTLKKS